MNRLFRVIIAAVMMLFLITFSSYAGPEAKTFKFNSRKAQTTVFKPSRSMIYVKPVYNTSFKTYKVIIRVDKLNIRYLASSSSKILGIYRYGNVVDVIGRAGNFVKTVDGYIAEAYTKKIVGMYAAVSDITNVTNTNGKTDDRVAIPGKWYRIIDSNNNSILIRIGSINGYINQSSISSYSDNQGSKITLGWEYLNKASSNAGFYNDPNSYVNTNSRELGLDVLSPTWFDVKGNSKDPASITISDIGDKKYVSTAHKNGYEVWARLCEMDKTRASVEFSNSSVRANLINQIAKLAVDYDLDGINVDYEALGIANRDGFTNFMKELYSKLNKLNLNVSVDITKISQLSSLYSLCYDRPSLAKYSDYLILMGYDEHYSTSTEAGSVGSYNFVNTAISDIIKQGVPSSKLILAVPFYLRDFAVMPYDGVVFNAKGKVYITPAALDNNQLLYTKAGNLFKCIGSDGNWYIVDYNGIKGYIKKDRALFLPANQIADTSGSAVIITTGGGINLTSGGAIGVSFPYDTIIINQDSSVYRSENEIISNKLGDTAANDYFKYKGTQGDWYVIDYKGSTGYVLKSQAAYYKADTRALYSSAISMNGAQDKLAAYNGNIYEDNDSRQSVGVYYKDGIKHLIWLETGGSMGWRMDLVNQYNLAGAGAWSLYWKPTQDIWDAIKDKLKN